MLKKETGRREMKRGRKEEQVTTVLWEGLEKEDSKGDRSRTA